MKVPLQITSRNMSLSDAAEETIREKAAKLDQFYDRITSCRILIEAPHRHSHQGVLYNVTIDITVPGSEIIVKREPREDLYVAIRDAFDAARRQIQDYSQRRRGDVKVHEGGASSSMGRVIKLFSEEGYGFIGTDDGREIYFHHNSLTNGDFDSLTEELEVKFSETVGDNGPQASAVTLIASN